MATKSVLCTDARVAGGKLFVYLPGKHVLEFASVAEVDGILDALRASFSHEAMIAMALKKVGQGNHNQLDGKLITIDLDVTIGDPP